MNRFIARTAFASLLLAGFSFALTAQTEQPPAKVRIGVFVNDIYDINLSENSFATQFWVWLNYDSTALQGDTAFSPLNTLEITNAKSVESDDKLNFTEASGAKEDSVWAGKKIQATMKKEWDIRTFPFDKQTMTIDLEDSESDSKRLEYVADFANTKLDERVRITNWIIQGSRFTTDNKAYNTTYGDPALEGRSSAYPHAQLDIFIRRDNSWMLFWSLFTGLYVAFFISALVFWIDADQVDPRFGLSVGGLFAAVGNKYIVDSILPQSTTFTLVDKLHVITYFFLLLCILLSVISLRVWKSKSPMHSRQYDRRVFWIVVPAYMAINIALVLSAAY